MISEQKLYGSIEAGGTKFIAAIMRGPNEIMSSARFDTVSPEVTIGSVIEWLKRANMEYGPFSAIGIASFGPLELHRIAPNWGYITSTTKPGWSNSDFAGRVEREMKLPIGFDTDVNGAALAESRWGAGQGQRISVYITVGTGIGGGAIVDGRPLVGLSHPEMGHIRPVRHADDTDFRGICPFHGDCLEGLASGPAIMARWGASLSDLPPDHPAHGIIAYYLAQMAVTLQSIMEPGRIILGGGVMGAPGLLERVQNEAERLGAGYFRGATAKIIVAPGLGEKSGILGGLALAMDAAPVKSIGF
jgi:fructokinase